MSTLSKIFGFLLAHADLVEDVVALIESGVSKDAIKKALHDLKVEISDEMMRKELGL